VLSLPQILERGFAPEDLRYFFLQAHYRSFQDFTREGLEAAKKARDNFIWKLTDLFNIDSEKSLEYLQNFNNLVL
jgi:cysteinyl-tRNA synthetase